MHFTAMMRPLSGVGISVAMMVIFVTIPESYAYTPSSRPPLLSRKAFNTLLTTAAAVSQLAQPASAAFTPGGTLVDRDVGVTVGNDDASTSRAVDNSNVLFNQDHYFKFGVAAAWIPPGSTDFPKTMPFTPSQQRYETLKKYGDRVTAGARFLDSLGSRIESDYASIPDPSSREYALIPMGLLANGFLASENMGTTNELFLARWYVNEVYLAIGDIRKASNGKEAKISYTSAKKAINSYFTMMNRVITPKVGDKFELLQV